MCFDYYLWHSGVCCRVGQQRDVVWHLGRRTRGRISRDGRKSPALESSGAFSLPVLVTAVHACMQNLYLCLHLLDCSSTIASRHTSLPAQPFAIHNTTLAAVHTHTRTHTTVHLLLCQDWSYWYIHQSRRPSTDTRFSVITCAMPFYPHNPLVPASLSSPLALWPVCPGTPHYNRSRVNKVLYQHYYDCCNGYYLLLLLL